MSTSGEPQNKEDKDFPYGNPMDSTRVNPSSASPVSPPTPDHMPQFGMASGTRAATESGFSMGSSGVVGRGTSFSARKFDVPKIDPQASRPFQHQKAFSIRAGMKTSLDHLFAFEPPDQLKGSMGSIVSFGGDNSSSFNMHPPGQDDV